MYVVDVGVHVMVCLCCGVCDGCWCACVLVCMCVGMHVCWCACVLVCMCVGVHVCWCALYWCALYWCACVGASDGCDGGTSVNSPSTYTQEAELKLQKCEQEKLEQQQRRYSPSDLNNTAPPCSN